MADAPQQGGLSPHSGQRRVGVRLDAGQDLERVVPAVSPDAVHDGVGATPNLGDYLKIGKSLRSHARYYGQHVLLSFQVPRTLPPGNRYDHLTVWTGGDR